MEFADFEIRAWKKTARSVQVLVHSSPAGEMAAPVDVDLAPSRLTALANVDDVFGKAGPGAHAESAKLGSELASILLPPPVSELLDASFNQRPRGSGLRIRLCLDSTLSALPWELMFRKEKRRSDGVLDGFLILDPRVSLVRGVERAIEESRAVTDRLRLVFAGAFGPDGEDLLKVTDEYAGLSSAIEPISNLVLLEPCMSAKGNAIEAALARPAAIFHYAGHVEVEGTRAYLVKEFHAGTERLYADVLSTLLERAAPQLAVFTACNSAHPAFVTPLLSAGCQAIIGGHGFFQMTTAVAFSERLYGFLAVGLSLDRAVIAARQHLVEQGREWGGEHCEWGRLVVHMPAREPVLFPRTEDSAVRVQRDTVLAAHHRTMDRRALREAMVRAFNSDDLRLLCADIEQSLGAAGIHEPINLDVVGGTGKGLEVQILELIGYMDRHHWYVHLDDAVRAARPDLLRALSPASTIQM